jgi:hypothetical protein
MVASGFKKRQSPSVTALAMGRGAKRNVPKALSVAAYYRTTQPQPAPGSELGFPYLDYKSSQASPASLLRPEEPMSFAAWSC